MKLLRELYEKVYPTVGELKGQQIPVTVQGKKMFIKFVANKPGGINLLLTNGQPGRGNQQRIAAAINQARTLEDTLAYVNQSSKETGRPSIKLGH